MAVTETFLKFDTRLLKRTDALITSTKLGCTARLVV